MGSAAELLELGRRAWVQRKLVLSARRARITGHTFEVPGGASDQRDSALALVYVIGAYAITFGIITIGGAFYLPIDGTDSALVVLGVSPRFCSES